MTLEVKGWVITIFHVPVTRSRIHGARRAMPMQEIRVEKYASVRRESGQLHSQLVVAKSAETPGVEEGVEPVSAKALPGLLQEFKILGHGDNVLVAFLLLADLEVALDIAGNVGFKGLFYQGAELLFGSGEIGLSFCDVEKAETVELPEDPGAPS